MKDNLLTRETRLSGWLLGTFCICAAAAVLVLIFDASAPVFFSANALLFFSANALQQSLGLLHFATGLMLSGLLAVYMVIHFLRTLGMRRPMLLFTGLAAALLLTGLAVSGWRLGLAGHREAERWIYYLHYGLGFAALALVAMHIFLHYALFPKKRKARRERVFNTIDRVPLSVVATSMAAGVVLASIMGLTHVTAPEPVTGPAVADYEYIYGPHPFRPSQTETHNGGFIAERDIANSAVCADCHADIAAQWASSAHRHAASDAAYVSNITFLENRGGIAATRYCEGCHTPTALLGGALSSGGRHGGVPGSIAHEQGVTCVSCHRITNVEHTKGVASYEFTPATPYLFAYAENPFLQKVNRFLIRAMPRQHRREMAAGVLGDPKHCSTCHTQFMDKDMNGWGWIKMQDEYSAWLESPYAAQHEQRFANTNLMRCQDCHMPLVKASDPSANSDGMVRDHRFPGANTMLPTINGDREQLEHTVRFLQNNKMRISIQRPYRESATQNLQALAEELRSTPVKPWYFYKDEAVELDVIVSNIGVGHDFPGGTIDINQAWVHFKVSDAEGSLVYESGHMDEEHYVDPEAYFYRSLPVDRSGQLIWQHHLFDMIGEVSRNTVKAGESDVVNYKFTVPAWVKSPLFISTSLMYRKFNNRYAKWSLKDKYQPLPVTEMARAFLSIPVRDQVEANADIH